MMMQPPSHIISTTNGPFPEDAWRFVQERVFQPCAPPEDLQFDDRITELEIQMSYVSQHLKKIIHWIAKKEEEEERRPQRPSRGA
jgi:hypothetical protein